MTTAWRRARQPATTVHGTRWGTMDPVGHGEARPASLASRPARGGPLARVGRAWALWAGAVATVGVGVAGALSFGTAPGSVSVPPSVALPATAQAVPPRVSAAHTGSLQIVPAVHPVIVEPPESGSATDGEGTSGDATGGADDSGTSGTSDGSANAGTGTTSPTTDGSGDATSPGTTTGSDGTTTTGSGDGGTSGSTDTGQSSDGTATSPTTAPSKESDN